MIVISYDTSDDDLLKTSSEEHGSSVNDEDSSNVSKLFSSFLSNLINYLSFMMIFVLFDISVNSSRVSS